MKTIHRKFTSKTFKGNSREAIFNQMKDGNWYSLRELAFIAGITEAGASARIRDLRKSRYGSHTIEAQAGYGATPWLYRLDGRCQ